MLAANDVPIRINTDGTVVVSKPLGNSPTDVVLSALTFPLGS
jgi:hypothetical protein